MTTDRPPRIVIYAHRPKRARKRKAQAAAIGRKPKPGPGSPGAGARPGGRRQREGVLQADDAEPLGQGRM